MRIVNPEALDFDVPSQGDSSVTGYRVELFAQGATPGADPPVKSIEVAPTAARDDGSTGSAVGTASSSVEV